MEKEVIDSSNQLARVCYSPDFEKLKPEFLKALPEKTKFFAQFLGKRCWFAGDELTSVDFLAYDILDLHPRPVCLSPSAWRRSRTGKPLWPASRA